MSLLQYPRPLGAIHQIEITSRCNLRCLYCPHSKMKRAKEDMTGEIFRAAMDEVKLKPYSLCKPCRDTTEI